MIHRLSTNSMLHIPYVKQGKTELIFGGMLQFNVVWCIRSSAHHCNGKQGYKVEKISSS